MKHNMSLRIQPFDSIWIGEKTIELRLLDDKRRKISVGDQIEFSCLSDKRQIIVCVIAIHVFENFQELYMSLPLEKCGYSNCEHASFHDMEQYYSLDEQKYYGVIGIEFVIEERKEIS